MEKTFHGVDRDPIIECTNHCCGSNGGTNFDAIPKCSKVSSKLREHYAGLAAREFIAKFSSGPYSEGEYAKNVAKWSVEIADALIDQLAK